MATVTNTGKNMQTWPINGAAVVRLMPGDNELTDAQYKGLSSHPVFKDYVTKRLLYVTSSPIEVTGAVRKEPEQIEQKEKAPAQKADEEDNLDGLSQRELIKKIAEMTDKGQLEALSNDGRHRVADAAKQQLASL
jgi:hypothetical protein